MPNNATLESHSTAEAEFIPYTVDIATRRQHEAMHTALGIFAKSLERVAKQLDGVGAGKENVVLLIETTEDMMDQLEGQYTLFNAMVSDLTMEDGDADDDTGHLFPE
jgi:Ser-tRNA(Ala) deacylase AlaX